MVEISFRVFTDNNRSSRHEQLQSVWPLLAWQQKAATPWTSWKTPAKSCPESRKAGLGNSSSGEGRGRRQGLKWKLLVQELKQLKKQSEGRQEEERNWRAKAKN